MINFIKGEEEIRCSIKGKAITVRRKVPKENR